MFNIENRAVIIDAIESVNADSLFNIIQGFEDHDQAIRDILSMIAANQTISRDNKILLRSQVKVLFRSKFGDRIFFVDSPLHRKNLRRRYSV